MKEEIRRQYWDSSVFVAYLNEEQGRSGTVEDLLNSAHAGNVEIVTSSFALVEVLKLKGSQPISERAEQELVSFFEYPFIKFFDADRNVCEQARRFVWKHGLKPKDAVHLATADIAASRVGIDEFFTWDNDFIKFSGTGIVPFPLSQPYMQQLILRLREGEEAEDDHAERGGSAVGGEDGQRALPAPTAAAPTSGTNGDARH